MHSSRQARGQATVAADRWGHRVYIALLLVGAMSAAIVGFGHHHAGDEELSGHHCGLCHVQQTALEPAPNAGVVPIVAPDGRVHIHEPASIGSLAPRFSPPLRGPPAC